MINGDLSRIRADVGRYLQQGYFKEIQQAARYAQSATREYIERMHPATGFSGKDLHKTTIGRGTDNQIQKGSFTVTGTAIDANIYANYFARWYNTGVYFKPLRYGSRAGELPSAAQYQPPRGTIFVSNRQGIENYFAQKLEEYMKRIIKIRR